MNICLNWRGSSCSVGLHSLIRLLTVAFYIENIFVVKADWESWQLHFKKKKKTPVAQSSKGAYEEAMQALTELRKLNEQGGVVVKEYHTKLADVLRNYYGKTFNQNYQNKTTQEILAKLKSHELNAETATHATEALATGDAVKFAKYHPSFTENEAALNYLKTVIEEIETSRIKKD